GEGTGLARQRGARPRLCQAGPPHRAGAHQLWSKVAAPELLPPRIFVDRRTKDRTGHKTSLRKHHAVRQGGGRVESRLTQQPPNLRLRGALCVSGAVAIASTLDALTKWLSGGYPVHEIMLVRCLVSFPIFILLIAWEGGFSSMRPRQLPFVLLRGLILASANLSFYLALAAIP